MSCTWAILTSVFIFYPCMLKVLSSRRCSQNTEGKIVLVKRLKGCVNVYDLTELIAQSSKCVPAFPGAFSVFSTDIADEWGSCSRQCDIGTQSRNITVGGEHSKEMQYCNLKPCTDSAQGRCTDSHFASCWHVSREASCVQGECICNQTYYNDYNCMAEVGTCYVRRNPTTAAARVASGTNTSVFDFYGCTTNCNCQYEVHIVAMFSEKTVHVQLKQRDAVKKPIILILVSFATTEWTLHTKIPVFKLVMNYYAPGGTVNFDSKMVGNFTKLWIRDFGWGKPSSSGEMLSRLHDEYGPITSFIGYFVLKGSPATIDIFVGGNPLKTLSEIPPVSTSLPNTTIPAISSTHRSFTYHEGTWMNWSSCSSKCNLSLRCRNGSVDTINEKELPLCNKKDELWSSWGTCSKSCEIGTQKRHRTIKGVIEHELQYCNLKSCAVSAQGMCTDSGFVSCSHIDREASCIHGECICSQSYLNKYTCIPEVGNCYLRFNSVTAIGKSLQMEEYKTLRFDYENQLVSCTTNDNEQFEVHVVAVDYISQLKVLLKKRDTISKPILLILSSEITTNWTIVTDSPIQKVILNDFSNKSKVESEPGIVNTIDKINIDCNRRRRSMSGFGGLLSHIYTTFGPITSFTSYGFIYHENKTITILIGGNALAAETEIPPNGSASYSTNHTKLHDVWSTCTEDCTCGTVCIQERTRNSNTGTERQYRYCSLKSDQAIAFTTQDKSSDMTALAVGLGVVGFLLVVMIPGMIFVYRKRCGNCMNQSHKDKTGHQTSTEYINTAVFHTNQHVSTPSSVTHHLSSAEYEQTLVANTYDSRQLYEGLKHIVPGNPSDENSLPGNQTYEDILYQNPTYESV